MTHYPNSDCEKHRGVTTDTPICPVCLVEKIDALAAEIERLNKALDEMGQCTIYNVASEKARLENALDEIIARSTCQDISLQQHVVRLKAIACAARNVKLCCKENEGE